MSSFSNSLELIIITGTAGAGKSTVLRALEDAGVSCVDNLPVPLVGNFLSYLTAESSKIQPASGSERYALLLNCYTQTAVAEVLRGIEELKSKSMRVFVLFLDARDEILIQRFRETRRPHPMRRLSPELTVLRDAIHAERQLLAPIRSLADRCLDTSSDSPHDLRRQIQEMLSFQPVLELTIVSFGFKYGIPFDADLVFDVRFLPNPYFVNELREKTGLDPDVKSMVLGSEDATEMLRRVNDMASFLVPRFQKEGKRYATLALGCTGGKHRSVALAEEVAGFLQKQGLKPTVRHRDISKA